MTKLGKKRLFIIFSIAFCLFALVLFGITGLRTILGLLLVYLLPIYLILDNFDLEFEEKIIFSLFISFSVYSLIVYWLSFLLSSIRISIVVTFVILIVIGLLIRKFKNKKETEK